MSKNQLLSTFTKPEQFYSYFEENCVGFSAAISLLVENNTVISMYVIVQIFGNAAIPLRFNWNEVKDYNLKYLNLFERTKENLLNILLPQLHLVRQKGYWECTNKEQILVPELSFDMFKQDFIHLKSNYKPIINKPSAELIVTPKKDRSKKKAKGKKKKNRVRASNSDGMAKYKFEYGLSDW